MEAVREERAAKKTRLEEEKHELDAEFELCFLKRDAEGKCQCGLRDGKDDPVGAPEVDLMPDAASSLGARGTAAKSPISTEQRRMPFE